MAGFELEGKEFIKFANKIFWFSSLAFPDYKEFPSIFSQFAQISFISGNITFSLCLPEFCIGCRLDFTIKAFVHMPETAVNKYDFMVFC